LDRYFVLKKKVRNSTPTLLLEGSLKMEGVCVPRTWCYVNFVASDALGGGGGGGNFLRQMGLGGLKIFIFRVLI